MSKRVTLIHRKATTQKFLISYSNTPSSLYTFKFLSNCHSQDISSNICRQSLELSANLNSISLLIKGEVKIVTWHYIDLGSDMKFVGGKKSEFRSNQ